MKKRIFSLCACSALLAGALGGAVGCGGGDDAIKLTVWGAEAQQATLAQMAEAFKQANPDKKYDIKVGVCGEGDAYMNIGKDPSAGPDVYGFSNDQLIPLLRVGAVAQIGGSRLEKIKAENSAEAVASGAINYGAEGEKVYGYPYASDNGYFMYYDKSVITEEQTASLESIISACEGAGKKIGWAIDDAWYSAGFFFAFGCDYSVEYDYDKNYTETKVEVNFNGANGLKASKAIAKLTGSKSFAGKNTNNDTIISGFGDGSMAVAVSGTWNAKAIQQKLGENYGVCKLPTVTVDGETKQLSSFKGYKLYAVNPHTQNPAEAHNLAQFLASEAMQKTRYENHLVGPTNTAVANLDAVKTDITLSAINAQNAFAVPQTSVPANFWNPLKAYGGYIIDKIISETDSSGKGYTYENYLNKMVEQIKDSLSAS